MTTDAFLILKAWIDGIWKLFTCWYIPGTRFTPAQWFFFLLILPLTVKLIKSMLTLSLADYFSEPVSKTNKHYKE